MHPINGGTSGLPGVNQRHGIWEDCHTSQIVAYCRQKKRLGVKTVFGRHTNGYT